MTMTDKVVVLVSGGLDSSTCLARARAAGHECIALSFDYGQRHGAELQAARNIVEVLGASEHRIMRLGLDQFGGSALTEPGMAVPETPVEGIPVTYVPARNTIFLSLALALAEAEAASEIYIGVNAVDYSGYPDCRPEFIEAFQRVADLGTRTGCQGGGVMIQAPLIGMSKAEIIAEGNRLGVDFSLTVSCYQADDEGRACGRCDACRLRRAGFMAAGCVDPTRYLEDSSG